MDGPRDYDGEVSQTEEENVSYDIPYMQNIKRNDGKEFIYKTETDSQTWKTNLRLQAVEGKGQLGIWDGNVDTAVVKMNTQQGPSTGNSAGCYVAARVGGESGDSGYMYVYG